MVGQRPARASRLQTISSAHAVRPAHDAARSEQGPYTSAITSTSTRAPLGSFATPTAERAGRASPKDLAYSALNAAKSSMSSRKHVVEVGAGLGKDGGHVLHDLRRLLLNGGADKLAGLRGQRDLAAGEQQVAADATLHVGADGRGGVRGGDDLHDGLPFRGVAPQHARLRAKRQRFTRSAPKLAHGDVALTVRIPGSVSRTLHQALNLGKASNFVALIWNLPIVAPARL